MLCPEPLSLCYGNFGALIYRLLPWYFCDCAEAPLAPESIGLWASSHCRNLQEVKSTSAGTMLLHPSLVLIPVITDLEAPNKGSVGSLPVKVTVVISCLSLRWQATKLLPPLLGPHLCEWQAVVHKTGMENWFTAQDTLINTQINVFSLFPNRISCQNYALYIFHPYLHSSCILITVFCLNDAFRC